MYFYSRDSVRNFLHYVSIHSFIIDEERLEEALNETKSFSSRDGTDKGILQMEITNDVVTTASKKLSARPTSCIWTKDELEVFRDGYLELKKKSVNLLLMLSDAKSQNKELKKMCKSKENIIKKQNGVLSEQKKQNIKLNTTIIELRKDLDFSDQKLQHLIRTGAQLKDQVLFLKSELEEERKELSKVRKLCKNLEKSLHRHQKEAAFGLMQQGNILKAKFLHKIDKLEGENKALVEELQEERRNHKQTKTALEQLRRHFANLQASGSARDFLDVAEISC